MNFVWGLGRGQRLTNCRHSLRYSYVENAYNMLQYPFVYEVLKRVGFNITYTYSGAG